MQPKELVKKIPDNTRKAKDVEIAPFPSLYLFLGFYRCHGLGFDKNI